MVCNVTIFAFTAQFENISKLSQQSQKNSSINVKEE